MHRHIERVLPSNDPRFRHLRFLLFLLATSLAVFAYASALGCNGSGGGCPGSTTTSQNVSPSYGSQPPVTGSLGTGYDRSVVPGTRIALNLAATFSTGTALFKWSPPEGASGFTFTNLQPQAGGPPFVFANLSPAQAQAGIPVSYAAPFSVPTAAGGKFWDMLDIAVTDVSGRSRIYLVEWHELAGADLKVSDRARAAAPRSPAAFVPMYDVSRWVDIPDVTMSTALCQSYTGYGQSSNMFWAWRVPIANPIFPDVPYQMPIVANGSVTPTVSIQKAAKTFDMPMEIRPDLTNWANLNLPSAAGAWWLALAADQSIPLTCPAGFDFPPTWELYSNVMLDMNNQPNQCNNCLLPSYACFKSNGVADLSSAERLLVERGSSGFGSDTRALSLPGGWLCFGPNDTLLTDFSTGLWKIEPLTAYVNISATQPIIIHYYVDNFYSTPQTFSLNLQSDLAGATWTKYPSKASNVDQPDLTTPLGNSITVPASSGPTDAGNHIWMLASAPAGSSGQYDLALTLSNAGVLPTALTGHTTIWVGRPPHFVGAGYWNPLYLPMVTR